MSGNVSQHQLEQKQAWRKLMTKLSTDKARTRGCDQTVVTGETAVEDTQN